MAFCNSGWDSLTNCKNKDNLKDPNCEICIYDSATEERQLIQDRFINNEFTLLVATKNYTQEQLAELAGVSCSFVGHIERGEKILSLETLARLRKAFDAYLCLTVTAILAPMQSF